MRLAVIGDPISHSLSPAIHKAVFHELGLPLTYSAHRVLKGTLAEWLRTVQAGEIDGFNVTMPHKQDIAAFCGNCHATSINTVAVRDGILCGYSTDEDGFILSLHERGFSLTDKVVIIAGRGGVSRALGTALTAKGAAVERISVRGGFNLPGNVDLFINATPLGMEGCPDGWKDLAFLRGLPKEAVVYDLIYNPPQTALLREASALGLQTVNGLDMLIHQAILSDGIYLGRELDTVFLKKRVTRALSAP